MLNTKELRRRRTDEPQQSVLRCSTCLVVLASSGRWVARTDQGRVKWRDRWTLPEPHLVRRERGARGAEPGSVYLGMLELRELEVL